MRWILFLLAAAATADVAQVDQAAPNREPALAASGEQVALVFGSGKAILFAKSMDGGRVFSKPSVVATMPILPLTRHRGPRVAYAGRVILVSAIGGTKEATGPHAHGLPADGDLKLWRSVDGGGSWTEPVVINNVDGAAREGLHALAADQDGNALLVWLDLRTPGTRLFGSFSKDAGKTWSPNFQIYASPDGTICQCCHPSLQSIGHGEFAVMFRNALASARDMYVLRVKSGQVAGEPAKQGRGTWPINACPMDGGGLALLEGRLLSAWRRGNEVFLQDSAKIEQRIGEGKDVALAVTTAGPRAIWVSDAGVQVWANGGIETVAQSGAFPALLGMRSGGAVAAWEADGGIATRRLE